MCLTMLATDVVLTFSRLSHVLPAGRCRQLQRCFEVLDRMTAAGVPSNGITYTCLIEAAVLSGDVDMAQRVFARAMAAGITNSVQVRQHGACAGRFMLCMLQAGNLNLVAWSIYPAAFQVAQEQRVLCCYRHACQCVLSLVSS